MDTSEKVKTVEKAKVVRGSGEGSLMLTRHIDETIVIDGCIEVTVVAVLTQSKVRLAIRAPREIVVDRKEIHEKKLRGEGQRV